MLVSLTVSPILLCSLSQPSVPRATEYTLIASAGRHFSRECELFLCVFTMPAADSSKAGQDRGKGRAKQVVCAGSGLHLHRASPGSDDLQVK